MKILLLLIVFLAFRINPAAPDEQQQGVGKASVDYDVWRQRFTCRSPYPNECVWLKNNEPFDPSQHRYHYEDENNCVITANDSSVGQLHGITCRRYINYTIINATVGQSVELNCPLLTEWYARCVWKRNDVRVSITGKYPSTSNLIKFQNCSIRIQHVNDADVGIWTCSDYEDRDIIAAYSLAISNGNINTNSKNNSQILKLDKTSGRRLSSEAPPRSNAQSFLSRSSTLVIAFSVGTIALSWILIFN